MWGTISVTRSFLTQVGTPSSQVVQCIYSYIQGVQLHVPSVKTRGDQSGFNKP